MILYIDSGKLEFMKNGISQGIAYKLPKGFYHFALELGWEEDTVEITNQTIFIFDNNDSPNINLNLNTNNNNNSNNTQIKQLMQQIDNLKQKGSKYQMFCFLFFCVFLLVVFVFVFCFYFVLYVCVVFCRFGSVFVRFLGFFSLVAL